MSVRVLSRDERGLSGEGREGEWEEGTARG